MAKNDNINKVIVKNYIDNYVNNRTKMFISVIF